MVTKTIYAISDSLGETVENLVRATVSQYNEEIDIIRIPYIKNVQQIEEIAKEASENKGLICYTIVSKKLREAITKILKEHNVLGVDVLGPLIDIISNITKEKPKMTPGLIHKLDQEYFKKVEAIDFAVKYDDGKNALGFLKADVVIIGVSRTSKTPLSMYLAHKKVKVANLPLVPEIPLPAELFEIPSNKIVGLIIDPYKLNTIRTERLKAMGLKDSANYADLNRIMLELKYAKAVMRKLHCAVIDVSEKAIEETANNILEILEKNKSV